MAKSFPDFLKVDASLSDAREHLLARHQAEWDALVLKHEEEIARKIGREPFELMQEGVKTGEEILTDFFAS